MIVLVTPAQIAQRRPENWPDQLREVADIIDRQAGPGDAVAYIPVNRRAVAEAYPRQFGGLRDIGLSVSPARAANFGGFEVGAAEMRQRLLGPSIRRVWVLEGETLWRGGMLDDQCRAKIETLEGRFRRLDRWQVRGLTLTLYAR